MPETPREYKKRIDEKWERNEKNKDELIKKIEGYELLDERFKIETKQEILANFEKNQKADLEGEQYKMIVSELGKIDKKYEELEDLKKQLKEKRLEKSRMEKEIKGTKLDGADETTLKLQMGEVRKLNEKLEKLLSEIEELNKEIKNRKKEIKVIEESYGKKVEDGIYEETQGYNYDTEDLYQQNLSQPETLKEVHEQTIKDLWSKDKTRKNIIKLLDNGTGIDEELKVKIKNELFEKFFNYYDEKQGNLKVKSARYMKNKLKNAIKQNEKMKSTPEGLKELSDISKTFGSNIIIHGVENEEINEKLKKYHQVWKREMPISKPTIEKIINAAGKISVKIEKDSDGSRLITLIVGNKKYQILDPILDKHSSSDSDYSYDVDSDDRLIKMKKRQVYSRGIIGKFYNWNNKQLGEYVRQKMEEGLHLAKKNEIKELLDVLGKFADLESIKSQMAMLMYLTGLDGGYRLFGTDERPYDGVFFDKSLDFHDCGNTWRLNILMMNVTDNIIL